MTRVVLDTNVLVSALLNAHGAQAAVLALIIEGQFIWCVSEAVLAEYELVLNRSKFQHLGQAKIVASLALASSGGWPELRPSSRALPMNRIIDSWNVLRLPEPAIW